AARRHSNNAQPFAVKILMIKSDRCHNDYHARIFALLRIQTQVTNSACDDQTNVTVTQMILPDRFKQRLCHFLPGHGNLETNRARRIPKALQVLLQAKNAAVIKTYALENSVAVEQTMIEHRNLCVCFRIELPVDVNLRFP